jgi:hypothetical protein
MYATRRWTAIGPPHRSVVTGEEVPGSTSRTSHHPLNTTTRADPEHGNETFDLRPFASPLLERNEGAFRLCSPSVEPFQTAILDRLGDVFSVDAI